MAKLEPRDENQPSVQGVRGRACLAEGTAEAKAQRGEGLAWPRSRKEATGHQHTERGREPGRRQEAGSRTSRALRPGEGFPLTAKGDTGCGEDRDRLCFSSERSLGRYRD